ncbi:hypothetical protein HS088_TW10G00834 [Tripterygium wilfordii]|uniref:Uncharacterized protein n=1 Tax=Tripterygium wilfordii TaxID=458696 RepID=A0A7J7D696_TRIWF|nr:hypothetical protein HS088_TW10G00834 [Tripterygium wilfordii]
MGWNYPEISLEDTIKLIKGFVDILILGSGYQSSGLQAHWDIHNIKKALQWGSFFENFLGHLSSSDVYKSSVKELDAAISEMTSDPYFPQGLAHLSSATLCRARKFVLKHLFHTLPLRDMHLRDFLLATIETDLNQLSKTDHDCLDVYLNKLRLQNSSVDSAPSMRGLAEKIAPSLIMESDNDSTTVTIHELLKRQSAVSCLSMTERGLDVVAKTMRHNSCPDLHNSVQRHKLNFGFVLCSLDQLVDFVIWDRWKSKNLSYFLDKRTVKLVSGASLMFSAPNVQWAQVLERVNSSPETEDVILLETIELLLLGCIFDRWNHLIEYFMSVSYNSITVSEMYRGVCNLRLGRSQSFHSLKETTNSKESSILVYLAELLGGHLHQLLKLSPALVAAAIPIWSPLFGSYISEIETLLKGEFSKLRCCSCIQDEDHKDCELAERIWCLYVFNVCSSHQKSGGTVA